MPERSTIFTTAPTERACSALKLFVTTDEFLNRLGTYVISQPADDEVEILESVDEHVRLATSGSRYADFAH